MKNKTLASIVLGISSLFSSANAETFNSNIIDSSCWTSPAFKIDKATGTEYVVWSNERSLLYSTSLDNFTSKNVISNEFGSYSNPSIDIDSNGILHVAFIANDNTYYTNSSNWNEVKFLGSGNYWRNRISLAVDKTNKVYVAATSYFNDTDEDIIISSSDNYKDFSSQRIKKYYTQINPKIAIDSKNNVNLIYWDWSDGVSNHCGQYKTRYSNSIDNYVTEQTFSPANQSYGADMAIDSKDNVWIVYKDTTDNPDESFEKGDIWTTDKDSGWNRNKVNSDLVNFLYDRPVSLAIGSDDSKNFSWVELKDFQTVYIMYGRENSPITTEVIDVGYNIGLGWTTIGLDSNNNPILFNNLHSLVRNESVPEPTTLSLVGLGGLALLLKNSKKKV